MSQQRPDGGRSARPQAANPHARRHRSRPTMAATPPSLTTPPPHPNDQVHQSFVPHHDYTDIFSFMPPTAMSSGIQNNGYGVDGAIPDPLAPPPPPPDPNNTNHGAGQQPLTDPREPNLEILQQEHGRRPQGHSSDSEDDSEDEDADGRQVDDSWYPIIEEKREYIDDELKYWNESKERSAHDHAYWEKKAFTDIGDPDIKPGRSGRIDFTIDPFNGTKEKPNKELVMRSEAVSIGGYEWRLKLYPQGNNTDHLSLYIENVTMRSEGWDSTEEFDDPPLPFLSNQQERPRKRRCVAAQVCVVLYNPTEPRQFEHRDDAHQFTKDSPDYGWTRFSSGRRRELGMRNHFHRAPILQHDKLAFRAYIRVMEDPTGCLWDHGSSRYDSIVAATGLRPFSQMLPILASDIVLLHFPPFRELVYKWRQEKDSPKFVSWMNLLLWKMLSRERSEMYGEPVECEQSDAVGWMQRAAKSLQEEDGDTAKGLLGTLDPASGAAVGGRRLNTKTNTSVQAAIDAHEFTLETPALLTLELERRHFDKDKREWTRVTNKVDVQDSVKVQGRQYKLFAFVTHYGELSSNNFKTYVRPRGPGSMWYGYSNGRVTCMTRKQALGKRCGRDEVASEKRERSLFSFGRDRRGVRTFYDDLEVAHVLFYVRDDYSESTFAQAKETDWQPPKHVKQGVDPEEATNIQNGPTVIEEKEVPPEQATKRASVSSKGSAYDAGCATPTHWYMDEDGDVVMSDQEDDIADGSINDDGAAKADRKPEELVHRTIDSLGCAYYSGQMLGSKFHGQGHLITLNGDQYTGTFSYSAKHGTGKIIYAATGDTYDGAWENNQRHGRGRYIEASTSNVFDGTWKHDKRSGQFTLTGTVTEEDRGICGICYEREMNTAFYDCGHVVACFACAGQIEDCPVCRRRIVSRLQLFGVKVSLE